jgi:hypothetical protein
MRTYYCDLCKSEFQAEEYEGGTCEKCGTAHQYEEGMFPTEEAMARIWAKLKENQADLIAISGQLTGERTTSAALREELAHLRWVQNGPCITLRNGSAIGADGVLFTISDQPYFPHIKVENEPAEKACKILERMTDERNRVDQERREAIARAGKAERSLQVLRYATVADKLNPDNLTICGRTMDQWFAVEKERDSAIAEHDKLREELARVNRSADEIAFTYEQEHHELLAAIARAEKAEREREGARRMNRDLTLHYEERESDYNAGWNAAVNDPKYWDRVTVSERGYSVVANARAALHAQIANATSPEGVERAMIRFYWWDQKANEDEFRRKDMLAAIKAALGEP